MNVDIELLNGSSLVNCAIFKETFKENKHDMEHITDSKEIAYQLSKMPWGNEHRFVYFQNASINGKVNVMSVKHYHIKDIEGD